MIYFRSTIHLKELTEIIKTIFNYKIELIGRLQALTRVLRDVFTLGSLIMSLVEPTVVMCGNQIRYDFNRYYLLLPRAVLEALGRLAPNP